MIAALKHPILGIKTCCYAAIIPTGNISTNIRYELIQIVYLAK